MVWFLEDETHVGFERFEKNASFDDTQLIRRRRERDAENICYIYPIIYLFNFGRKMKVNIPKEYANVLKGP